MDGGECGGVGGKVGVEDGDERLGGGQLAWRVGVCGDDVGEGVSVGVVDGDDVAVLDDEVVTPRGEEPQRSGPGASRGVFCLVDGDRSGGEFQ